MSVTSSFPFKQLFTGVFQTFRDSWSSFTGTFLTIAFAVTTVAICRYIRLGRGIGSRLVVKLANELEYCDKSRLIELMYSLLTLNITLS